MPHTICDKIRAQFDAKGLMVLPSTTDHVIVHPSDPSPDGGAVEQPATDYDDTNLGSELAQIIEGRHDGPCTRCGDSGECPVTNEPCPKGCGGTEERPVLRRKSKDVQRELVEFMREEMSKAVLGESMVGGAKRSGE